MRHHVRLQLDADDACAGGSSPSVGHRDICVWFTQRLTLFRGQQNDQYFKGVFILWAYNSSTARQKLDHDIPLLM